MGNKLKNVEFCRCVSIATGNMAVILLQTKRNIAATLRRAKESSGKTMEEFAAGFDLQKSTLQKYMGMQEDEAAANPTIDSLDLIGLGLNMTVAQLVSDPNSLEPLSLGCANCMKMPIYNLHPKLHKPAELMLELFCMLSRQLYENEDLKKPISKNIGGR